MNTDQQAILQHPYYLVNHYNFLKNNDTNDEALKQRSALYFNDAGYLYFLLNEDKIADLQNISPARSATIEIPSWEKVQSISHRNTDEIIETALQQKEDSIKENIAEEEKEESKEIETDETAQQEIIDAGFDEKEIEENTEANIVETINETAPEETIAEIKEEKAEETEITQEQKEESKETETDEAQQKLASVLDAQLADFKKPVTEETELVIATEPYHTVDYFASQGIKADQNDKFTRRVKKFTDWLKDMKTVPTAKINLNGDAENEIKVMETANASNETAEIITESMAEVLVKQGKKDGAVELYEKLSLLHPEKNAYFAAKISQLKD